MTMFLTSIRRRPDGSIDTDFYVAAGKREHGRAIRAFCARLFGGPGAAADRATDAEPVPRGRTARVSTTR